MNLCYIRLDRWIFGVLTKILEAQSFSRCPIKYVITLSTAVKDLTAL